MLLELRVFKFSSVFRCMFAYSGRIRNDEVFAYAYFV